MKNEEVTLILAGGNLSLPFLENVIKEHAGATIIAADRGLEACMKLQIEPDYVIGDFDSLDEQVKDAFLADRRNVTKLNPIKDDTDSEAALHLAFEKTKGDIFLLGGTGTRLDHVLGNIAILGQGFVQDRHIFLLDEHNRIRLIQKECRIKKEEQYGKYVSVVSFCGVARGVSESGVFYPLDHVDLQPLTSLGISNEIVDEEAVITVEDGTLIVIESKD